MDCNNFISRCSGYLYMELIHSKFNQQYMKKLFSIIALLSTAIVYGQNNNVTIKAKTFTTAGKKIIVYTTADNTSDKLSVTDTLVFKHMGQPFETQVCVFVDPTKTFQTILGIGGALTDASAEAFAKLPADKQNELLKAYYDVNNGIGYTLART